ncbi:PadR family transcriptional regulator [Sphingomonas sp.]|uniref:PadR family transcriptional regulator n=1 Tax=Sphingomonas sp. TaxID=28214 RepID=UPI0025EA2934|nr:PadR family transcriptional regulator [Sphingomonas sp.]MBV9527935.1 PadR family transcriptional regulator [Sphingomonas sp.]
MNSRFLILGVLHRGDFHPYEIKRRLQAAMVECYVDADVGTLYYAVRQLEKDELIVSIAQERVARGGMRTIYRITDEGRARFREELHRQLDAEGPVAQTLYGALLFLHFADPGVVKEALRRRIARLDELIAKLGPIREQLEPVISTGSKHLLDHIDLQRRLDRSWLEDLLADITRNGIRDLANAALLTPR